MEKELYELRKQMQALLSENDALKQALANARKIAVEQREKIEELTKDD
jgi:transposase-like protein